MTIFGDLPTSIPHFTGRAPELRWLDEQVFGERNWGTPIFITGVAGIGKTTLLNQFLSATSSRPNPRFDSVVWRNGHLSVQLDLASERDPRTTLDGFIQRLYEDKDRSALIVAIDGADVLSDLQIETAIEGIFNLKRVRSLIVVRQNEPDFPRKEVLHLGALPLAEADALLRMLLPSDTDWNTIQNSIRVTQGNPLAASLLAEILRVNGPEELSRILSGRVYDLHRDIALPSNELIVSATPKIVVANEQLLASLKKQPESIYSLPPRKFEEVIAELLTSMGWQVELTKATRDGGKDILAYLATDIGKLLCLVEAKKYRRERKIGVELVRSLYGTLCDYQANSAMLVTTSSFTSDAHHFQRKHRYQLALRDYGDIVQWIQRYKKVP
jgi:restriction system protein